MAVLVLLCSFGCHIKVPTKRGMILRGDWAIEYNRTPWIGCPPDVDCGSDLDENGRCKDDNCLKCQFLPKKNENGSVFPCPPYMMPGYSPYMMGNTPQMNGMYYPPGCAPAQMGMVQAHGPTQATPGTAQAVPGTQATPLQPPRQGVLVPNGNGGTTMVYPQQMIPQQGAGMYGMTLAQQQAGMMGAAQGGAVICQHANTCPPIVNPQTGQYIPLCLANSQGMTMVNPVTGQVVPGLSMSGTPAPGYPPIGYTPTGYSPGYPQPIPAGMIGSINQMNGRDSTEESEGEGGTGKKKPTATAKSEMPHPSLHPLPTSPIFQRAEGAVSRTIRQNENGSNVNPQGSAANSQQARQMQQLQQMQQMQLQQYYAQQQYLARQNAARQGMVVPGGFNPGLQGISPGVVPAGYNQQNMPNQRPAVQQYRTGYAPQQQNTSNPLSSIFGMFDFKPEDEWQEPPRVVNNTSSNRQLQNTPPVVNAGNSQARAIMAKKAERKAESEANSAAKAAPLNEAPQPFPVQQVGYTYAYPLCVPSANFCQ